jgi:hypothetical protein
MFSVLTFMHVGIKLYVLYSCVDVHIIFVRIQMFGYIFVYVCTQTHRYAYWDVL